MALKGNLQDFPFTQLLNLINLAQKTGALTIAGSNDTAQTFFLNGNLTFARMGREENGLVTILYKAAKLSANQHRIIKARTQNMSEKELGLLLINANYVSRQEILNCMRSYYVSVIKRLFTWPDGRFQFDNDVLLPHSKIPVRVSLENIIIEGSRQMHEWQHLTDEIPSLEMALKFTDRPGINIRKVNLSVNEWKVASYISPKNTITQIAHATKMNDLEIRKIVYGLLQAGLVELVRPVVAVQPRSVLSRFQVSGVGENKEEKKTLINRLIDRIRSL